MIATNIFASFAIALALTGAPRPLHAQTPAKQTPPQTQPPPKAYKPDFEIPKSEAQGELPRQGNPAVGETYVIGPQDQLQITVTDESEMSGKYRVDTDGSITFPYLQRVPLAGLTLADAQTKIAQMLQAGYLKNPQVRVEVDQFKSRRVMVSGEVRIPGPVTMAGTTMTLLEALAAAGSPTQNASNDVIVVHPTKPGEKPADSITVSRKDLELGRADVLLQDGDIINVPQAKRFYISGFVKNTGYYVLDSNTTVSQAIVLAGGLSDRGSDRRIKINRMVKGKMTEISVDVTDKVLENDEIKIPSRFF
jgi:polysaccharide export outer membrane protein